MAWEQGYTVLTLPASTDLSTRQYTMVIINTSGQWAPPGAAAAVCHGILLNAPSAAGHPAEAALISAGGVCKLKCDGTVETGDPVGCLSATGKGREAVQNDYIMGYAVEGSATDDVLIPVALGHNGRLP